MDFELPDDVVKAGQEALAIKPNSDQSAFELPDDVRQAATVKLNSDPNYDAVAAGAAAQDVGDTSSNELAFQAFKHEYHNPKPFSAKGAVKAIGENLGGLYGSLKGAPSILSNAKTLIENNAEDLYTLGKMKLGGDYDQQALDRNDASSQDAASEIASATGNAVKGTFIDLPYALARHGLDAVNWVTGNKLSDEDLRTRFDRMAALHGAASNIVKSGGIPGGSGIGPEARAERDLPLTGKETPEQIKAILDARAKESSDISQDIGNQTGAATFALLPNAAVSNPLTRGAAGAVLRGAGAAVNLGAKVADKSAGAGTLYGIFTHSPETVAGSLAAKALPYVTKPAANLLTEAGDAMFTGERVGGGLARRVAGNAAQAVATGGVIGTAFAAGEDSPEKAIGAIVGGAVTGPLFMGDNFDVGKSRSAEMGARVEARDVAADRAERFGALQTFGEGLPRSTPGHDEGMAMLPKSEQDKINLMQGFLAGQKNTMGGQIEVNVLPETQYNGVPGSQEGTRGFVGGDGNIYLNAGLANQTGGINRTAGHEIGHVAERLTEIVGGDLANTLKTSIQSKLYDSAGKPVPEFKKFIDNYNDQLGGKVNRAKAESEFIAETTAKILQNKPIEEFTQAPGLGERLRQGISDGLKTIGIVPKAKDGIFSWQEIPKITANLRSVLQEVGRGAIDRAKVANESSQTQPSPTPAASELQPSAPAQSTTPATPVAATTPNRPAPDLRTVSDAMMGLFKVNRAEADQIAAQAQGNTTEEMIGDAARKKSKAAAAASTQPSVDRVTPAPEPSQTTSSPGKSTGAAPAFISRQMEQQLADLGWSKAQRYTMKPADAVDIINNQRRPESAPKAGTQPVASEDHNLLGFAELSPSGEGQLAGVQIPPPDAPVATAEPQLSRFGTPQGETTPPRPQAATPEAPVMPPARPVVPSEAPPRPMIPAEEIKARVEAAEKAAREAELLKKHKTPASREKATTQAVKEARIQAILDAAHESAPDADHLQRREEYGVTKYTGLINEEIPAHSALLDELGTSAKARENLQTLKNNLGKVVFVDYKSAAKEGQSEAATADVTGKQRSKEYKAESVDKRIEDAKAGDINVGTEHTKAFYPLGFRVNPETGSVTATGFSPNRFLANAAKIIDFLRSEKVDTGYTGADDPQLLQDMQGYAQNHANGYKGDGKGVVQGAEVNPSYVPHVIDSTRFDLLNAAMANESAKNPKINREGSKLRAADLQQLADFNGNTPTAEGETNKLRDFINSSGRFTFKNESGETRTGTKEILEPTVESLRVDPELMRKIFTEAPAHEMSLRPTGVADPSALTSQGIPKSRYVSAGFMPGGKEDLSTFGLSKAPKTEEIDNLAKSKGYNIKVAHSTNAETFNEFKTGGFRAHFGTEEAAQDRAQHLRDFSEKVVGRPHAEARVMPLYLKMENPLRLPDLADLSPNERGEIMPIKEAREEWLNKLTPEDRNAWENPDEYEGDVRDELQQEYGDEPRVMAWEGDTDIAEVLYHEGVINRDEFWDVQYDPDKAMQLLKEKGYDGIVYKNNVEGGGKDSYIAFDPEQIKSAEDITKDDSGKEIPALERFDSSKKDLRFMPGGKSEGQLSRFGDEETLSSNGSKVALSRFNEVPEKLIEASKKRIDKQRGREYELRKVEVSKVKPTQTGEDYINSSSEETAKQLKNPDSYYRHEDALPIELDEDSNIKDGNHRHAAATMNGDKYMMAFAPKGSNIGEKPDASNDSARFMPGQSSKEDQLSDFGKPDELGFYSGLARIIQDKIPNKASPEQILNTLKGAGAKQEEMDSMGLPEFIKTHDGPVTKQSLQEFVKAGGVQFKEVEKGEPSDSQMKKWGDEDNAITDKIAELNNEIAEATDGEITTRDLVRDYSLAEKLPPEAKALWDKRLSLIEDRDAAREKRESEKPGAPKFSQYQLPGGENYSEHMLVMPRETNPKIKDHPSPAAHQYEGDDPSNNRRLLHIRQADHVDVDGNKVRLIEEIQSDRNQEGRERGYQDEEADKKFKQAQKEQDDFAQAMKEKYGTNVWLSQATPEEVVERERINNAVSETAPKGDNLVPKTPFQKSWAELGFKRALRLAVEDGQDKIAWTTGEQQAARYDLSKQIDGLQYQKNEDGTYAISAQKGGNSVFSDLSVPEAKLSEIIGKELAQKVVTGEEGRKVGKANELSGLDLKVGGEGMKGFYDKILHDFVRKYIKKLDKNATVETTLLGRTEKVRPQYDDGRDAYNVEGEEFKTIESAKAKADELNRGTEVHSVTITPAIIEAVMAGQSLFMPGSKGEGKGDLSDFGTDKTQPSNRSKVDKTSLDKLREEQQASPEFKKFFAGSKATDEDGNPEITYHSTDATKRFHQFDNSKSAQGIHWFTNDRTAIDKGEVGASGKGRTIDAYLSIKNPAGWEEYENKSIGELIRDGYDGLKLPGENGEVTYAAFEPNQVKSASGNTGSFSEKDNDIRFMPQGEDSAPQRTWFMRGGKRIYHHRSPDGTFHPWPSKDDKEKSGLALANFGADNE